ncbi:MAG: winged helix-turn-helix domain-containing protein [Pseudomonadota bacterium]
MPITSPTSSLQGNRLAFESFVFDRDAALLTQAGRKIELRPKSMQVLDHLLSHPNTLISKRELLDAVWGKHAVVSEDSLVQCVIEIRKALGDDGKQIVQTVTRRGYRFVADVVTLSSVPSTDIPETPPQQRNKTAFLWLCAAGVVFVAMILWPGIEAQTPSTQRIAVADFEIRSPRAAASAMLLAEALRLRLDEIPGISIRSFSDSVEEGSMALALDRARELDVDWLVSGALDESPGAERPRVLLSLWNTGNRSRFSMGVYDLPQSDDTLTTQQFASVREAIVERALSRMPVHVQGPLPPSGFPEKIADFETYSYVMSQLELERCNQQLVGLMEPVVERTPEFMRGWMALAWAHWVDSWACGLGEESLAGAAYAAERVLELRPAYPSAVKVKTSVLAAQGNLAGALTTAQAAVQETPNIPALWATLSYLLNYSGRLGESEQAIERALELDPLVLIADTGETPNVFLYVGKWERFLATQPVFDAPYFNFQRAYAHYRSNNPTAAIDTINRDLKNSPSDIYARFSAALLAIIEERPSAAQEILLGIVKQREQTGQSDGETTYREAVMFALTGDQEHARQQLWRATRQGFVCRECVERDDVWQTLRSSRELNDLFEGSEDARAAATN